MKNNDIDIRTIDLEEIKLAHSSKKLNESYADIVAFWISAMMDMISRQDTNKSFQLKGSKEELGSLLHVIGLEKRYLNTAISIGLDKPQTKKVKAILDSAITDFENKTGIKWPFKN